MSLKRNGLILVTAMAFGCAQETAAPMLQADAQRVVHTVHVGGPDNCSGTGGSPGCDANFSLVAIQFADGSVSGQWIDRFSQENGGGGIHIIVNCLAVAGHDAWISGIGPEHPFGNEWVTRVRDNGTSANDAPDQISLSLIVGPFVPRLGDVRRDCHAMQDLVVFDAPQGQVVVR